MITNDGFLFLTKCIKNNATFVQARIGGTWKTGQIKDIETTSTAIQIKCYFDETIIGAIDSYRILLKNGDVLLANNDAFTKDDSRGLLVMFEIKILEGQDV